MISNKMEKLFMSLSDELNKSYPTMRKYIDKNCYPADICIAVEELTAGRLRAVDLRPDLFKPNKAQLQLANNLLSDYQEVISTGSVRLIISLLNYFEHQCPSLYKNIVNDMCETEEGKELIRQRLAHKQNECN